MKAKTNRSFLRVMTILMAVMMVFTMMPMTGMGTGFASADSETVEVSVKAAPSTVNVEFFNDETGTPVDTGAVTDNGISGKYHSYTLNVPAGNYYYRGTDGSTVLGGECFTVQSQAKQELSLLRANIRYNGKSLNAEGDYTLTLKNGEKDVTLGTPYVTSEIRYIPSLLIAGAAHSGTVALNEKWEDEFYLTSNGNFSSTPSKTATATSTINLPISAYKIIRVTAPSDAKTVFYKQDANYVVETVTPDSTTTNTEDGTTTYIFKGTAAHSNYQFRSMMPGQMTQAGYLADGNNVTVSFSGDPNSSNSTMPYDDKSVLMNIKTKDKLIGQNKLNLEVGDTFKLRAFRAAWEIINTTSGNQMIEPDFHFAVLSGDDVVSIAPTTECTNSKFPNAKNGNATGNWMNVTALKKGTAVVAVWYDAINVFNANPPAANDWSVFGATDPARYGVFVVSVGDDTGITWNPVSHDGDWDAEFDVVYYNGDKGYFTFKPAETVSKVSVQNVYGETLSSSETVSASADGSYAVPVTSGANIIAVTTDKGTDYMIVRAKKISYTITNDTTGESKVNDAPVINTEDTVTISFDKLDMPIPKMSGIYNPGYMGTAKTAYMLNDSMLLTSAGTQYDFATKNSITFKAHIAGENSLKGYISLSSMGDPFGNHRGIDDNGKPVNMNAGEVFGDFGVLPDIKFTVTDNGKTASYEDATKITSLTVKGANSTGYLTGFSNWTTIGDGNSNWTAATSAMAAYTLTANVKTTDYYNKLQLRYWYDGEEVHTTDLIAGATNTINGFTLEAEKILNLQVVITPMDPKLGAPKTYTYIVYPGNANLKYIHPVIKSLTAKNTSETSLVMDPVFNTADTAYTLYVGDAEKISLAGEQLIKIYNTAVTADKSDSVVLTKMKDGSAVGDSITILEAGVPTNPNRYWNCNDLDITDADALQITVTSYVNSDAYRTYNIALDKSRLSVNAIPTLAENVSATKKDSIKLGETYSVDLNSLFTDADKEPLHFTVKNGDADAIAADAEYTYTPTATGTYTLVFRANDGTADSTDTYTVTLTVTAKDTDPILPPAGKDELRVKFRLVGAEMTKDGKVDLENKDYHGGKYVTWIPTTVYTMDKGSTVGDLLKAACDDAGLRVTGLGSGYISQITAPDVLGGYALGEFSNGSFDGWMYTVNGQHPNVGLNDRVLADGDSVVWHYVYDYRYEVNDWDGGSYGDPSIQNGWLKAADKAPEAVKPDTSDEPTISLEDPEGNTVSNQGTAKYDAASKTVTITPNEGYRVKDVKINGTSVGDLTVLENVKASDKIEIVFEKKEEMIDDPQTDDQKAEQDAKVKAKVAKFKLKINGEIIKSGKRKGQVKFVFGENSQKALKNLEDMGYQLDFYYYKATKKDGEYKYMSHQIKHCDSAMIPTKGVKGTTYYYDVKIKVRDSEGNVIATVKVGQVTEGFAKWKADTVK